jgi:hypothetical protein
MKKRPAGENKGLNIAFRCSVDEYNAIRTLGRNTTCRSFSEYARKVLLAKPVAITHRNLSLDRLIDTMAAVQTELGKLLELKTLSIADRIQLSKIVQEIKDLLIKIFDECILNKNQA